MGKAWEIIQAMGGVLAPILHTWLAIQHCHSNKHGPYKL